MKRTFLLCLLIVAAVCSKAQTAKLFVTDTTKTQPQQLLFPNRIISKTQNGTVYALPQDKMPCLVPDSSIAMVMPNAYKGNYNPKAMPNPYNNQLPKDTVLQLLKRTKPKN